MARLATPVPRHRRGRTNLLGAPHPPAVPHDPSAFDPYAAVFGPGGVVHEPTDTVAEKLAPLHPSAGAGTASPPRHSGGTSGDLTVPGYTPATPTVPYAPGEPGHSAQDFARAFAVKRRRELLGQIGPLPAPVSPVIGQLATAAGKAIANPLETLLGRPPTPSPDQLLQSLPELPHDRKVVGLVPTTPTAAAEVKYRGAIGASGGGDPRTVERIFAASKTPVAAPPPNQAAPPNVYLAAQQKMIAAGGLVTRQGQTNPAGLAVVRAFEKQTGTRWSQYDIHGNPTKGSGLHGAAVGPDFSNTADPLGAKTLGNASVAQLAAAAAAGKLRISGKGILSTPQNRAVLAKLRAASQAAQSSKTLGKVPAHGTLTPEQIGTLLVEEGRGLHAHLNPAEVAEGIGVAEAESAGNADEQRQLADFSDPEDAHIGLFAEEGNGGFGGVQERLNARSATHGALERFLADDRSWNPAWVHWQEIQGEEETGADRAPQYRSLAQELVHASGKADPKAAIELSTAKALAREAGIDPDVVLNKHPELGPIEPHVVSRFHAALAAAKALAHGHIPYVWGGGHAGFVSSPTGLDCSGAVSWVLHKMGVLDHPLTSGSMGEVLEPGPGAVTVYYNAGHTFMKIGKRFFGTSVDDSSKGLAFYGSPPPGYLNTFSVGHIPGLGKKVALQLGIKPGELSGAAGETSSGGITYTEGGSKATIEPGTGKKVTGGAKYSTEPILPEFGVPAAPSFAANVAVPEISAEPSQAQELLELLTRASGGVNRA